MDKTTLVDADLRAGRAVIDALEDRGFEIDVAAWLQDDETGLWRLVVSSPGSGETGARPIHEAILDALRERSIGALDLSDFYVASPHQHLIRDLKRKVGTDHGLHDIRLDLLSVGNRFYRSSRIERVVGDAIGNGARVRVKATGRLGTVRGVIETSNGPRYLVLFDQSDDSVRPFDGTPRLPAGQNFAADDLDFLYLVRTGGWPERLPDWLLAATGVSAPSGDAVATAERP